MRITKYTHACVRLEADGQVLVIDPGIWAEPEALYGADAVLLTHQHADHVDALRLAGAGVPVYLPAGADLTAGSDQSIVERLDLVTVEAGQEFTAAGFPVRAYGGRHAETYDGLPDCANLGYLVNGAAYHPGDALAVPDQPVETLMIPAAAPWLKLAEALDFIHAIKPERSFAIHDAQLNGRGRGSFNAWVGLKADFGYRWLNPEESL
jgi:L-ascorbate metabolism protein UlaG (beta-lactamase superfamily)